MRLLKGILRAISVGLQTLNAFMMMAMLIASAATLTFLLLRILL